MAITSLSDPRSFAEAESFVSDLLDKNKYKQGNESGGAGSSFPVNIFAAYSDYVNTIISEIEANPMKMVLFTATNLLFYAMNPNSIGEGKIYNPLTPLLPPPIMRGLNTTTLDNPLEFLDPRSREVSNQIAASLNNQDTDKLYKLYKGNNDLEIKIGAGIPPIDITFPNTAAGIEGQNNKLNIFSEDRPSSEYQQIDFSVNPLKRIHILFSRKEYGPGFGDGAEKGFLFFEPVPPQRKSPTHKRMEFQANDLDTIFQGTKGNDEETGFLNEDIDSDIYMPFWFTDLRNNNKRLYFRAFLTNLSEDFQTNDNEETPFGRTDPISIHQSVTRMLSVGFKIAAFSPLGLSVMWKKINNFIKMIYPTYQNNVMTQGPVVKLKIGDLIATADGDGLPGKIKNPSFNYTDSTWETHPEIKEFVNNVEHKLGRVPMFADVNFNFLVLHSEQPGLDINYNFNGQIFRGTGFTEREIVEYQQQRGSTQPSDQTENIQNTNVNIGEFLLED